MTFFVPIMLWGWIPFNIFLFRKLTPQNAILISVIGGVLFLPVTSYDIPMIQYDKEIAIALSLLIGIFFSGRLQDISLKAEKFDIPIITWCTFSPFLTILLNGLGLYNSVAAVVQNSLSYGVFYLAGRIFFTDKEALKLLTRGIIAGGLVYVPLVFFEVRMSPQLSNIFYGIFPHSFLMHFRYGGYRPIIFMNSGLMVSLWMSVTFLTLFWLYRTKEITEIKEIPIINKIPAANKIPVILYIGVMLFAMIVCKSANAWVFSLLGILIFMYFKRIKSRLLFKIIILIIPIYIILRVTGVISVETIIDIAVKIFDAERIESLELRLLEEDAFGINALNQPFFGYGWMQRVWPTNPFTGEISLPVDALYLIIFCTNGFIGLISLYTALLLGPWRIMKSRTEFIDAIILSLILIIFTIDTLLNAMVNPVYILTAGALISFSEKIKYDKLTET